MHSYISYRHMSFILHILIKLFILAEAHNNFFPRAFHILQGALKYWEVEKKWILSIFCILRKHFSFGTPLRYFSHDLNYFSACQTNISFISNTNFTNKKIQMEKVIIQRLPSNRAEVWAKLYLTPKVILFTTQHILFFIWWGNLSSCSIFVVAALRIILFLLYYHAIKTISL